MTTDLAAVRNAGFVPHHEGANPIVRNRIAAVNRALRNRRLSLDESGAPETTRALREHSRDKRGDPQKIWRPKDFQCDHYCDALGYMVWGLMPFRQNTYGKII